MAPVAGQHRLGKGAGDLTDSAREAALRILQDIRRQPALRVPLDDALDGVLALDIVSPLDVPAWANSAMDGYAVREADVRGASQSAPVKLAVVEHIAAGQFPTRSITPGACARIFTGAPLPDGADSVIRQEDTDGGAQAVCVYQDRDAGHNVRPAGEDIRKGDLVLAAGTELGPAQLGVLASIAVSHPMIYRRPRVGVLGTGDEIVDLDQADLILSGQKIASSNTHALVALVARAGGEPVNLGIARDSPANLKEHLREAPACDLLITSGGISVGEHDHLKRVMAELGAELRFWKVRIRPGAQVGFGVLGALPWVGLPGNPVSTMVAFELFVRPAIRVMSGHALPFRRAIPVRLQEPIVVKPRLQHFLRAVVTLSDTTSELPSARLTGPQGSGILSSMARANALLIIPEGQFETQKGAVVSAILLDDPVHSEQPPF
ncbi:MAG TPA: gephyrin-like molybdotransferase Glp [Gemmatimonadales bacterium]|nr:gephyrin-like molybdotransferase Glp [Gemmatimonadales bacterium]